MKHPILTAAAAALALLIAPQISAREVVAFRDGRYLEVRTHKRYDAYIRLEVTPNAYVICPISNIVSIERNGQVVFVADRRNPRPRPAEGRLRAATPSVRRAPRTD